MKQNCPNCGARDKQSTEEKDGKYFIELDCDKCRTFKTRWSPFKDIFAKGSQTDVDINKVRKPL